jgi:hypothetical protein
VNKEIEEQVAKLGELSDDALESLESQLVADAEVAAETKDTATLQQIADAVQAVRDERAQRVQAAGEVSARVDDLMKSIRPPAQAEPSAAESTPLAPATPPTPKEEISNRVVDDPFERAARRQIVHNAKWGFRIHFGVYAAVQVLLFTIWAFTPHAHEAMPWFLYPLLGWGVGVVAHYIAMRSWTAKGRPIKR